MSDEGVPGASPAEIMKAVEEAGALRHQWRAMRVTLECGHYRLMTKIQTIMGIGAITGCQVCSPESPGDVCRTVVNIEETGVLHEDWLRRRRPRYRHRPPSAVRLENDDRRR